MEDRNRPRRAAANDRLRVEYLATLPERVAELVGHLAGAADDDEREVVAHDVLRLGDTAGALELPDVQAGARDAAGRIRIGAAENAIVPLVDAVRPHLPRYGCGPVALLVPDTVAKALAQDGPRVEGVRRYDSVDALRRDVVLPSVVVLPVAAVDRFPELSDALGAPLVAYGAPADAARAFAAGAAAFTATPHDAAALWTEVRGVAEAGGGVPGVVLIGFNAEASDAYAEGLSAQGVDVAEKPTLEAFLAEDAFAADVVVAAAGSVPGAALARAVSSRPGTLLASVGGPIAGASLLFAKGVAPSVLADTVGAVAARAASTLLVSRATRLPGRAPTLDALDHMLARDLRAGQPFSLLLVEPTGAAALRANAGRAAVHALLRTLAHCLRQGTRRYDVVGHLAPELFAVGLAACAGADALRRAADLETRLAAALGTDPRFAGVGWAIGQADTESRPDRLLERAADALHRARGGLA